jgi:hypothetical protein
MTPQRARRLRGQGSSAGVVRHVLAVGLAIGMVSVLSMSVCPAGQVLITEQEAKLPPLPGAVPVSQRGITRGPRVELVAPAKGVAPASPMRLHIKFTPHGGATIDPDSVKVTYVKSPSVDLTSRVRQFTRPTGIDLADAELPEGEHLIRVDVRDNDGRTATTIFILKIPSR